MQPPFSARNQAKRQQIDQDFPDTARIGLLHVVHDLMDKSFLRDWATVATELRRIARDAPGNYNSSSASVQRAQNDLGELLAKVHWAKAFDFCERLHNHLAVEVGNVDFNDNYFVVKTRSEVQEYIAAELQRLFSEEGLAFEFSEGLVRRRGRKHTVETTTRADVVLDDPRLVAARKHYGKALQFFRHPSKPDYENCVKEAVCAVEAAGKALFPEAKASTLGELVKWMSSSKEVSLPKALAQTFHGSYGFRSGGEGIGHGGTTGGPATRDVAEFVLSVSASQIIYLVDIDAGRQVDVPF
jgi:hypothetical protein